MVLTTQAGFASPQLPCATPGQPLASRIIGRSHVEALKCKDMAAYINHHLKIAGVNEQMFSYAATLAIHEGSGGLIRRASFLAKGVPAWPPPMKSVK